jgi:hypothetical protein
MKPISIILVVILVLASVAFISQRPFANADGGGNNRGVWHLDEGTGTTASDSGGYDNDVTLKGGVTWTDGRIGKCLNLSSGYAEAPDSNSLDVTGGQITLEAWI